MYILLWLLALIIILLPYTFFIRNYIPIRKFYKIDSINLILIIATILLYTLSYFTTTHVLGTITFLFVYYVSIFKLLRLNIEVENYIIKKDEETMCYFHQADKRWKSIVYGNSTIGKTGCGVAVMAMVHSSLDKSVDPITVCNCINENYKIIKGTPLDVIEKYFISIGLQVKYLPRQADLDLEMQRNMVIVALYKDLFSSCNHLTLIYDIIDSKACIADPANYSRLKNPIGLNRLAKKVKRLDKHVTHPYIAVQLKT